MSIKQDDQQKRLWLAQLASVSKLRRRQIIIDAHEQGGLSYKEISEALGDISRQRAIQIVKEIRAERAAAAGGTAIPATEHPGDDAA